MENCKNGKCDVAARIAAARAGKARGTGAIADFEAQQRAKDIMWGAKLPPATGSGIGIGLIAAAVLVVIIMSGRK